MQKDAGNRFAAGMGGKNVPFTADSKAARAVRRETSKITSNMEKDVREHTKIENCQSPQACAVVKLMDDPFNAKWEDAKMPFYPGGQPLKTTVVRAYGAVEITSVANTATQIYWIPNAWAPVADGNPSQQKIVQGATLSKGIPGCPPFAVANASGTGTTAGPHAGFIRTGVSFANQNIFLPTVADTDEVLAWSNASSLGSDTVDAPGLFAYRLIAAAMRIIPTGKNVDLGGWLETARIGESTNLGYSGTTTMSGNSSVHYERANNTYEVRYARSADDDGWSYPSAAGTAASTAVAGARNFAVINPPDASTTNTFMITHVAFYEVKGVAAKDVGTESFQQPESASRIQTAMAHISNQQTGHENGSQKNEFKDMVELVNAKSSPATGGLAQGVKTVAKYHSKLKDFVKSVAPVAEKIALEALPFLAL